MDRPRVDDPELSEEANRLLTDELRAALGDAPGGTIRHVREASRAGVLASLGDNRLLIAVTFAMFVVLGVVLTLMTGSWWALAGVVAVHAVGTVVVGTVALQMTTRIEHIDPAVATRLEAAGVSDPDRALTDLVSESGEGHERHAARRRTTRAEEDPARAGREQRSALTPSAERRAPSVPVGGSPRDRSRS